jgi:uracil-DNA glycosylase
VRVVHLQGEADLAGWRREARALLCAGVPPEALSWAVLAPAQQAVLRPSPAGVSDAATHYATATASVGLFDEPAVPPAASVEGTPQPRVPVAFLELADSALLHDDAGRFALLYRLLWRLQREPGLRHDHLDPDWLATQALAKAVQRDQHKMRAFVRFHERATPDGPQFVAWFEPAHHIVASMAGFFQRRFASMRWAIFTPRASIAWDGVQVHHGGPARRQDVPLEDATQALWLTYYASIFNPARLKLATMAGEMPRKYWHNLPEARLIAPLARAAAARTEAMVASAATPTRRARRLAPPGPLAPADGEDALITSRLAAQACRACPHGDQATQLVWGEGPQRARVMVVGEQPGDQEDLQGRPFVGPAGQLLDRALAEAGVEREALYLTNAVKHFGFELRGKRRMHKTPGQQEVLACAGWLQHEIDAVQPAAFLALGATATQALLGKRVPIEASRASPLQRIDGRPVQVTWHPAALLRMPDEERERVWPLWVSDLRRASALP